MFVFIVGGGGAIGRACAVALAKGGLDVAVVGRTPNTLQGTLDAVRAVAPRARTWSSVADAAVPSSVVNALKRAQAELGQLSVFLYLAVAHIWRTVDHLSTEDVDRTLNVNIRTAMISSSEAIKMMIPHNAGTVVFITSFQLHQLGWAGMSTYVSTKYALHGFARVAFEDARHKNIKVSTICPQFVRGSTISNRIIDDFSVATTIAEEDRLQPEDVASSVMYIVNSSDTACPTEIVLQSQEQSVNTLRKFVDRRPVELPQPVDTSKRVAFLTGASRGIGRQTAVRLAKEGYSVALVARSKDALEETAAECRPFGVDVLTFPTDVSNFDAIEGAIHETVKKLGNINILINNAGVNRRRSSARSNREVWDSVMDINLRACMHTTRTALPYMMQNKDGGFIIYISSIVTMQPGLAGSAPYYGSKYGLLGFAGCVMEDVRHCGIKVSCICPGLVNNDMGTRTGPVTFGRGQYLIQNDDVTESIFYVLSSSKTACPTRIMIHPQKEVVGTLSDIKEKCDAQITSRL